MKTCKKILATILFLVFATSVFAATEAVAKKTVEGTQGYRDEINRPPEPWKGPPRSGEQVYALQCATCHARTTQGAPRPDDDIQWGKRARQGLAVLLEHTINGYNQQLMPPRGGCGNCSDKELKAAVLYILGRSGIKLPKEAKPKKLN